VTPITEVLHDQLLELIAAAPHLHVLSRPSINLSEFRYFLSKEDTSWAQTIGTSPAEDVIEIAGRICYMSFGKSQSNKSNSEYISHLIAEEHESVLEHASWTFLLTGVSRAFSHQLVRHRVGFSFSQLSQQYHDEHKARFVIPEEIKSDENAKKHWLDLMNRIRREYEAISRDLNSEEINGYAAPRELRRSIRTAARSVLPNATETKIVFSANARALRHFLKIRGSVIGDIEMRRVCTLLYQSLYREAPSVVADFQTMMQEDGYPIVVQKKQKADKIVS
jgi:thymidylate synthase (FAD)